MPDQGRETPAPTFRVPVSERLIAGVLGTGCLAVLVVAAWLRPDEGGHSTHTQMGLPECGWVAAFDKPCMTCGMTTAFSRSADADLVGAVVAQPMGAALSLVTGGMFWVFLHVAMTGSSLVRVLVNAISVRRLLVVLALALAAWGYKVLVWESTPPPL